MLTTVRTALAADLAALDVPVHTTWPDKLQPPCVLLVPPASGSYVFSGRTFHCYTVALDVVLLAPRGSFDVVLPALETLIEAVLANSLDWQLGGVDSPSVVTIAGADLLGTIVHLTKQAMV